MPTAELLMKTAGGRDAAAIAETNDTVDSIRLARISRLRSSVQRAPAMEAPARLITASDRSRACRQVVSVGLVDQRTSPSRCGRLVRIITRCPAARNALARAVTRKPLPTENGRAEGR